MVRSSPRPPLLRLLVLLVALTMVAVALPSAQAQSEQRYFPETGHTLRGLFRSFWEGSGALETFGLPITEEFTGANGRITQWFERARFELTEVDGQARVDLGLLGVEVTGGKLFPKVPPIENSADRRYIPETQHIIQYGFKTTWETRGDVRIFGQPISEEIDEILEDGEWHTVQYFERARFEYWPNLEPGKRVLLSHLGRKLAPADRLAPVGQPGQPAPAPGQPTPPAALPPSVHAKVSPDSGPPGTTFAFDANGFEAGERVGIWLTAPDQSTFGADFQAEADNAGSIAGAQVAITSDAGYPQGIWSLNAQGVRSGKQAIGYFRITNVASPGDPNKLGVILHDQLPRQGQAFILPVAAPAGATFFLVGAGFNDGEGVSAWFSGPDGKSTPVDDAQVAVDGTSAQAAIGTGGLPDGVYTAVAQGRSSGVVAAAAFKITRDYLAGPGTPRPGNGNGSATPAEGPPGAVYQIRGQGLRAGEQLEFWVTDPTGAYVLFPDYPTADGDGRIGYTPPLNLEVNRSAPPGVYGVHFRGRTSGARVDVYFTITGSGAQGGPGSNGWLVEQLRAWQP